METLVIDSYNKGEKEFFINFNTATTQGHFYILQSELSDPSDFIGKLGKGAIPPSELIQIVNELEGVHKVTLSDEWKLEVARANLLNLIADYDTSDNVNAFYFGSIKTWLPQNKRVGLTKSTNDLLSLGETETTLWLEGYRFTIPCNTALYMLAVLEKYALQCFDITEQHRYFANNATTAESILAYDYTANYPDMPRFDFPIDT